MAVPVIKFPTLMMLVRLMGVTVAALVLTWTVHYRGGLALVSDNKDLIFNVHPVLMAIGLVLLNGEGKYPFCALLALVLCVCRCVEWALKMPESELLLVMFESWGFKCCQWHEMNLSCLVIYEFEPAMLAYKTVSGTKSFKKLVHLTLQCLALCLSLIGLWAALKFHNDKGIDNFYSLHSWLGLACLILFAIQWAAGFVTFWYPGGSRNSRATLLPWHVFFGVYIYALAVVTATTGILEKATFLQTNKVISHYSAEALLVNSLGILIIVLGGFVVLATITSLNSKGDIPRNATE
ncbi:hypothetical protein SADUNF_Sadunf04G0081000 [Salix dunnii]|uniref:ascorbate ferrireductase (transmembrane) n=1 Tax=Salix dunnii TaxID=1413687 RepID=A0A835N3Y5_9ROSI|nr:hypothetical protein SADUNF_Sadunf04G0081000 [Salix dunnii]